MFRIVDWLTHIFQRGELATQERLKLFFPDYDRILGILYRSQNYTSINFLNTVDTVFRQFHAWPSAWPGLERLLAPEHPWSEAYCQKLIAGGDKGRGWHGQFM